MFFKRVVVVCYFALIAMQTTKGKSFSICFLCSVEIVVFIAEEKSGHAQCVTNYKKLKYQKMFCVTEDENMNVQKFC